jgi:CDP-glucose 4,6-dehydratase
LGNGATWVVDQSINPHEAHYLKLDISKAKGQLGWYPALSLSEALRMIVDWYIAYNKQSDMREVVLKQIATYAKLITKESI